MTSARDRRRGHGREWVVALYIVGAAAAAPGGVAQTPVVNDWRTAPVEAWLRVVEGHAPGILDSELLAAASWTLDDLRAHWIGASVVIAAATSTKRSGFDVTPLDLAARPRRDASLRIGLSRADHRDLERFVARVHSLGVGRLLKRAVLVHTDLVTMIPQLARASSEPTARGAPVRMNAGDGTGAGFEGLSVHWEVARQVLGLLPPSADADRFACAWYRATIAVGQHQEFFDARHLSEGRRRCPDDPSLLLLAGAEREAMASTFFQAFARSLRRSAIRPDIDGASVELEAADRFYRGALLRDASLHEARVRLGRVLIDRGRPDEAAGELRAALTAPLEPVLEYLATLFLGSALEATGPLTAGPRRLSPRRGADPGGAGAASRSGPCGSSRSASPRPLPTASTTRFARWRRVLRTTRGGTTADYRPGTPRSGSTRSAGQPRRASSDAPLARCRGPGVDRRRCHRGAEPDLPRAGGRCARRCPGHG